MTSANAAERVSVVLQRVYGWMAIGRSAELTSPPAGSLGAT